MYCTAAAPHVLLQYINISPEFVEGRTHRPNVFKQVQYAVKRLTEHDVNQLVAFTKLAHIGADQQST